MTSPETGIIRGPTGRGAALDLGASAQTTTVAPTTVAVVNAVSVNWHVWPRCNYTCKFCFATFTDIPEALSRREALRIPGLLASAGTQKLTFAGGEPLLCPHLDELLKEAKAVGMTTMIVTNGSLLTETLLQRISRFVDWIALSIDSGSEQTERALGRGTGSHVVRAIDAASRIRRRGIGLKVNTVVTALNWREEMSWLIRDLAPERWKVFQMLVIKGENDPLSETLRVTDGQFGFFLRTHEVLAPIPEDNRAMSGSYLMMDPMGRLFQNTGGEYSYSDPVLRVGFQTAINQVGWDRRKFLRRGGQYDWARERRIGSA